MVTIWRTTIGAAMWGTWSTVRVVDSSTFHRSPGTNPQETVMMMDRYMGVKILRERLGRAAGDL
ncbi:unnamed protein product [Musa hybrid cultivar]